MQGTTIAVATQNKLTPEALSIRGINKLHADISEHITGPKHLYRYVS